MYKDFSLSYNILTKATRNQSYNVYFSNISKIMQNLYESHKFLITSQFCFLCVLLALVYMYITNTVIHNLSSKKMHESNSNIYYYVIFKENG